MDLIQPKNPGGVRSTTPFPGPCLPPHFSPNRVSLEDMRHQGLVSLPLDWFPKDFLPFFFLFLSSVPPGGNDWGQPCSFFLLGYRVVFFTTGFRHGRSQVMLFTWAHFR